MYISELGLPNNNEQEQENMDQAELEVELSIDLLEEKVNITHWSYILWEGKGPHWASFIA